MLVIRGYPIKRIARRLHGRICAAGATAKDYFFRGCTGVRAAVR